MSERGEKSHLPRSKKDRIIPVAPVDRLIRKAGGARVSDTGAEKLAEILEEVGVFLARNASEIVNQAKRKTITDKDVELAYRQWRRTL
ncbi:MAG: histone family protein [Candidatus Thorarchaeota archaeon]|nr:histone family protein [Candidatus Thorarchaeota archaeon]